MILNTVRSSVTSFLTSAKKLPKLPKRKKLKKWGLMRLLSFFFERRQTPKYFRNAGAAAQQRNWHFGYSFPIVSILLSLNRWSLKKNKSNEKCMCQSYQNKWDCTFKVWWMWPLAFSMTFWVGFLLRIKVEHEFRCLTKKTKRSTKRTMAMADKVTAIPAISPLSNEATPPTKYPTCELLGTVALIAF